MNAIKNDYDLFHKKIIHEIFLNVNLHTPPTLFYKKQNELEHFVCPIHMYQKRSDVQMKLLQNVINYKINIITGEELLKYAKQFNVRLSKSDANKIAAYLRGKSYNIFDDKQRTKLIKEVAKITGPETAKEINRIFVQFTK